MTPHAGTSGPRASVRCAQPDAHGAVTELGVARDFDLIRLRPSVRVWSDGDRLAYVLGVVFQLGYVSSATSAVDRSALADILAAARRRNALERITGVLLYRDGRFLQLLEGEVPSVDGVYASILADPRHTDVRCVWTGHAAQRSFSQWTMGFRDLAEDPILDPAYLNLLAGPASENAPDSEALWGLWTLLEPGQDPTAEPAPSRTSLGALLGRLRRPARNGFDESRLAAS